MIVEFSIQNFRSIKELQTISFVDSLKISKSKNSLFSSIGIFGPNGSGKTNILKGLNLFLQALTQEPSSFPSLFEIHQPFLFSDSKNEEPSFFQIIFILDKTKYRYGFTVSNFNDELNILNQKIEAEWLFFFQGEKQFPIFIRDNEKINILNILKASNYPGIAHKHILYLNHVAAFDRQSVCFKILNFFTSNTFFNDSNSNERLRINTLRLIEEGNDEKKTIIDILENFGIFIDDIKLDEDTPIEPKSIYPVEKIDIFKNVLGQLVRLNLFKNESSGTIRLFDLAGVLARIFREPNSSFFLILDEIDNDFHPNLVIKILEMFNNPQINPNNSQILFSGHETHVMTEGKMSKFQFYLTERDNYSCSTRFYSLGEFKGVKNYGDFTRQYLLGYFGGLPVLKNYLNSNESLGN